MNYNLIIKFIKYTTLAMLILFNMQSYLYAKNKIVVTGNKRISDEKSVPFVLVRPYALSDKKGQGKYAVTKKQNGTLLKSISREDVATFMLDAIKDNQWDGSPGVLLGGAKS